jgi:hypothetical protein
MTGYPAHTTIGTEQRGAAIITRDTTALTSIEKVLTGGGTAALREPCTHYQEVQK